MYKLLCAKFDLVDVVSNHVTFCLPSLPLEILKTRKSFQNWWLRESNSQNAEDLRLLILESVKRTVSRIFHLPSETRKAKSNRPKLSLFVAQQTLKTLNGNQSKRHCEYFFLFFNKIRHLTINYIETRKSFHRTRMPPPNAIQKRGLYVIVTGIPCSYY